MSCTPFSDVREVLNCTREYCEPGLSPYVKQAVITVKSAGDAFFKAFDDFSSLDPELKECNILAREVIRKAIDSLWSKCDRCRRLITCAVDPEKAKPFIKEIIGDSLFLGHYINDKASIKAFNEFSNF